MTIVFWSDDVISTNFRLILLDEKISTADPPQKIPILYKDSVLFNVAMAKSIQKVLMALVWYSQQGFLGTSRLTGCTARPLDKNYLDRGESEVSLAFGAAIALTKQSGVSSSLRQCTERDGDRHNYDIFSLVFPDLTQVTHYV